MTLVTEGDGEMNREELKSEVERYCKNNLELGLTCYGLFCPDCPLYIKNNDEERCARDDDEVKEVLGEVWAETHGYVKKEDIRPKVNEEFVEDLAYLLQRGATFDVIRVVIGLKRELWMGEEDQEDNWYKWIMKNLFIEDTEEVEQSNEKTENTKPTKVESDPVNPSHYQQGDMQTIEKIMVLLGKEVVIGFCKGNAFKYTDRAGLKGSAEVDKAKADWYLRLAEKLENTSWADDGLEIIREFLKEEADK